jgi:hypothetical protein
MYRWIVHGLALSLMVARPLAAQTHDKFSFDLTVGTSAGADGRQHYVANDVAGEATVAFRPHPDRIAAPLAAITLGRRSPATGHGDAKCVLFLDQGGCAPYFPAFSHVGLIGGIELRATHLDVRVLAGPARYGAGSASGWGGQFHVDGAIGFTHLALVAAGRRSWISSSTGWLRCRSWEMGLRIE